MPVFRSDTPIRMGGVKPSNFVVIVADRMADLQAFNRRWTDSLVNMTPAERDIWREATKKDPDREMLIRATKLDLQSKMVKPSLTLPDRGLTMHKSKTQIRVLIKESQSGFLDHEKVPFIPKMYVPILNLMMRREYANQCGIGRTPEMETFFQREIRGKLIELLRSGQWVDDPESSELVNLNLQLQNFDLGRRSDLKYSSSQDEATADISEKFTPKFLNWKPEATPTRIASAAPEEAVPVAVEKPELKGLTGFHQSKYAKEVGIKD